MEKTIADWEREHGRVAGDRKKYPANKKITEAQFLQYINEDIDGWHGVNHEDRIKFLEDNGYAVTHANMIDSSLSARPPEE